MLQYWGGAGIEGKEGVLLISSMSQVAQGQLS